MCDSSRQNNLAYIISSQEELPKRNGYIHQSFFFLLLSGQVNRLRSVAIEHSVLCP